VANLVSTLLGLAVVTLSAVGMRLIIMQSVQQRLDPEAGSRAALRTRRAE
jgi:hypothetical protein